MIQRILLVSFVILFITSCKTVVCTTTPIMALSVTTSDSSVHISDTLMKLVSYPKNGLFQDPVDSVSRSFTYYPTTNILFYHFDTGFTINYDYDLLCTLYPSGKTFKVTRITHAQSTVQDDNFICKKLVRCTNVIYYYVNGKEMNTSGLEGTLNIDYN